jgi:hypothetical protein
MTGQEKSAPDATCVPPPTLVASNSAALATQPAPPPVSRLPITVSQIRDVIPKYCFERSVVRSFGHLAMVRDLMSELPSCFRG